jgi:cathepsin L
LTHKKSYSSPIEEIRRQLIFKDNVAKIAEHNAKFEKGEVTYSKAMNQFGDMSKEEFLAYVNRGKAQKPKHPENLRMPYVSSKKPLAASIDWRSNAVSEVKDQGQCGSCWSFSTVSTTRSVLTIGHNSRGFFPYRQVPLKVNSLSKEDVSPPSANKT